MIIPTMKKVFISIAAFLSAESTAIAQQTFSAAEFKKHLGKTGTLCDTVYSLKIVSDTLTLLTMGGAYPNQKYTVAIKGNRITEDWTLLKGKPLCVTGVFLLVKDRPEVDIARPDQINAKKSDKH